MLSFELYENIFLSKRDKRFSANVDKSYRTLKKLPDFKTNETR